MRIESVRSHVLSYPLEKALGYSQQYYADRSAHLVEVRTDDGLVGWGECFGPGAVARVNRHIVEDIIQPLILGANPLDRDVVWHHVYNRLRDHGQKGMPIQALSGVDIALWDLLGKVSGLSIAQLIGGRFRDTLPVYGYGMMFHREGEKAAHFADEAAAIKAAGFRAMKMKIGLGPRKDIALVEQVREAIGPETQLMVDANHCYTTADAFVVGRELADLGVYWFEEPIAPEDRDGYRELRSGLDINISGGEAEFTRWGWRGLLEARCLDIAQPEVCGLGGISEYLRVLALAHAHFTPLVNHVWGSAVSVATNLQLLAAMPDLPGGLFPAEPLLEFDTTPNAFRDELPTEPLAIQEQVQRSSGRVAVPTSAGHGIVPDPDFLDRYRVA